MKFTAFKYVQSLGKDSFQVSSQTQIQTMNLYLRFDVCILDSSLKMYKNDRAMELLNAQKENVLENVTELKSHTFFSVWIVWYWMRAFPDHPFMTNLHVIKLIGQFSECTYWFGNRNNSFFCSTKTRIFKAVSETGALALRWLEMQHRRPHPGGSGSESTVWQALRVICSHTAEWAALVWNTGARVSRKE